MNGINQINESVIKVLCWVCKAPIELTEHKAICKSCSRTMRKPSKEWIKEPESSYSNESIFVSLTPFPRR